MIPRMKDPDLAYLARYAAWLGVEVNPHRAHAHKPSAYAGLDARFDAMSASDLARADERDALAIVVLFTEAGVAAKGAFFPSLSLRVSLRRAAAWLKEDRRRRLARAKKGEAT